MHELPPERVRLEVLVGLPVRIAVPQPHEEPPRQQVVHVGGKHDGRPAEERGEQREGYPEGLLTSREGAAHDVAEHQEAGDHGTLVPRDRDGTVGRRHQLGVCRRGPAQHYAEGEREEGR